jgi:hypothetical protein
MWWSGIKDLELWFGETVGCGATLKLLICAAYLYSGVGHWSTEKSTGFWPCKIVHSRVIIVFCELGVMYKMSLSLGQVHLFNMI